jgi:hypothetical protein
MIKFFLTDIFKDKGKDSINLDEFTRLN